MKKRFTPTTWPPRRGSPARTSIPLKALATGWPRGIWSDGKTMWVADSYYDKVYAYDMATKARIPVREFNTLEAAGNWTPRGIWSDGATMWAADSQDAKIYSYLMPQDPSAVDRAALVAFYNATGEANWTNNTNWLTNAPVGQWYGVTTDDNGRVTNLDLNDNQLSGTIPPQLGNLANLRSLSLRDNQLSGEIPPEVGSLANLEWLRLNNNQLTGEIPAELGRLTNLTVLSLSGNQADRVRAGQLARCSGQRLCPAWAVLLRIAGPANHPVRRQP